MKLFTVDTWEVLAKSLTNGEVIAMFGPLTVIPGCSGEISRLRAPS